jgi:hypothetical protein
MMVVIAIFLALLGGPNVSNHAGGFIGPQLQGQPPTAFDGMSGVPTVNQDGMSGVPTANHDGMSGVPTAAPPPPAPVAPATYRPTADGMSGTPT